VRCSARRTRRDWILRSSHTEGVPREIREEAPAGADSYLLQVGPRLALCSARRFEKRSTRSWMSRFSRAVL
jgi:hypothetical protein